MTSKLEELMGYGADVVLEFQDDVLNANSIVLGLYSSVLRGAVEVSNAVAASTADGTSVGSKRSRDGDSSTIPIPGIKKDEWMQAAAFMYPVVPTPTISSWQQLETVLQVASSLDIKLVLHKAEHHLINSSSELVADQESEQSVWKWLRLADKAGFQECLPALAARAAAVDREGCAALANLQDLSPPALQQLIIACAGRPPSACEGDEKVTQCQSGTAICYSGTRTHKMAWVCTYCKQGQV